MQWDLFVSHASEDKEAFVKPLVDQLESYGLKVWYDEFELKIGDSLSASIDKGIIESKHGLIIISQNFLKKNWTDYELRSLLIKDVEQKQKILPIWYNVTKEEIMKRSLFLADKFALSANIGIDNLAHKIVEEIRPDIINSNVFITAFNHLIPIGRKNIELKNVSEGKKIHESLPNYILMSSLLITEIFSDVLNISFLDFIDGLSKDWDYNREYFTWNVITFAYLQFLKNNNIPYNDIEKKKNIIGDLLQVSSGNIDTHSLNDDEFNILLQIYHDSYQYIKQFDLF